MKKENIYYLLSVLIGLMSIPMAAIKNYTAFFICFSAAAILLLMAIYEDMDNIEF